MQLPTRTFTAFSRDRAGKVTVEQGIGGGAPGTAAAFSVIANLYFDSVEAFGQAFAPVAGQIQGDVANYTDVEPIVQVNDVKIG